MSAYRVWNGYEMVYQDVPSEDGACMKWTGLTDIKSKDIYEADIISNDHTRATVEYVEDDERFVLRHGLETRGFYEARDFVVLGNAFENRELV